MSYYRFSLLAGVISTMLSGCSIQFKPERLPDLVTRMNSSAACIEYSESKLCNAEYYINETLGVINGNIYKLLAKRDEHNFGLLLGALGLVYQGVASSPMHTDVTKLFAGGTAVTLSSKQYGNFDVQAGWYLNMNSALYCVKGHLEAISEAYPKDAPATDILNNQINNLQNALNLLSNKKNEATSIIKSKYVPFKDTDSLIKNIEQTIHKGKLVQRALKQAPKDIETELNRINMALLKRYVTNPPDISAITDSLKQYISTVSTSTAMQPISSTSPSTGQAEGALPPGGAAAAAPKTKTEQELILETINSAITSMNLVLELPLDYYIEHTAAIKTCSITHMGQ